MVPTLASAAVSPESSPAETMTPGGPVAGAVDLKAALQAFPLVLSDRPVSQWLPHWARPAKLVVVVDRPQRTAWLQQAMPPGVRVVGVANDREAGKELADADAYIMATGDCTPGLWKDSRTLRWVHSSSGGADQCLKGAPALQSGQILLTDDQKVKSPELTETAFGFILALARNMDIAVDNQRAGEFGLVPQTRPPKSLYGATMLVVGLGAAGSEIARLAHEFGMTVIATRASSHQGPAYVQYVGLPRELPDLIGKADVVVIAAPLTPQTRGLFNAALFSRMKRGAMLIDFTRAEIINPNDLATALKEGQVGSAGLSWASDEPLPRDSPLWKAPNLILTPWQGWGGAMGARINPGLAMERAAATATTGAREPGSNPRSAENLAARRDNELHWVLVRENMRRFARGERMYSVFDIKRGY
jgi:phosphoglycerate dehydrogenase-like enzyme